MKRRSNWRKSRKKPKTILKLPDLEHAKAESSTALPVSRPRGAIPMRSESSWTGIVLSRDWHSIGSLFSDIELTSNHAGSHPERSICDSESCAAWPMRPLIVAFSAPILPRAFGAFMGYEISASAWETGCRRSRANRYGKLQTLRS